MRIGVLAGEVSGDRLGGEVLAALRARVPALAVEGVGGPCMAAQGLRSLFPMERLSVMGLVEPLGRLPELLRIRRRVLAHFSAAPPDLFLAIDSPDFNLPLERRLRARGVTTVHLVSPSVWAWRRGRLPGIARAVDLMLCLFPFEAAFYREHGVPVRFVGHPLADRIPQRAEHLPARRALTLDPAAGVLALLPGSRTGEVRRLAPLFLDTARLLRRQLPDLQFVLPAANDALGRTLSGLLSRYPDLPVQLLAGRAEQAMAASDAVLLASGTATLEAALLGRPMVVAYRTGVLSGLLLRRLVSTPWIALPNILSGRALVPEFLQAAATPAALADALRPLLAGDPAAAAQLLAGDGIRDNLRRGFGPAVAGILLELGGQRSDAGPV